MTTGTPQRLIDGQRGQRYGEVLAAYLTDEGIQAHVYGTQMLNDCPQELWEQLDADAIAKDMEAVLVKLNGPRYWMLDGLGSKAQPIDRPLDGGSICPAPTRSPFLMASVSWTGT